MTSQTNFPMSIDVYVLTSGPNEGEERPCFIVRQKLNLNRADIVVLTLGQVDGAASCAVPVFDAVWIPVIGEGHWSGGSLRAELG
jgi:hypothetical protein